ncbi:DUF7344 domain-containing protein [Natronorubrum sp. FCH18a]|uniref:DUF7344 domain-containing protein n=1 Tax=Natronorubrum sp. FCH18a TaxID=3447018 RepID=UPI003F510FE3
MNSDLATERTTTAFDVLADPGRRYVLSTLLERGEPLSLEQLATDVAVRTHRSPIVTEDQSRTVHIELVHRHVPRLLDLGVLREVGDDETRRVALADHPLLETEWVTDFLETLTDRPVDDEERLNRTLDAFQPARSRIACALLSRRDEALPVADLAAMLVAREDETRLVDVTESDRRPVETTLVHNHLPALADVGLVEYDASSETVALAADASQWRANWLAASPLGEITARLEPARKRFADGSTGSEFDPASAIDPTESGACWTVEGRENVVSRGHDIADSAEEELFVTVPDAGMIQSRCLERWRAAAERGVDVYVGSRSQEVRNVVRSAVPQATICEPQFDWLNYPVDGVHHGRVVFADRDRVLLATIDDSSSNGDPRVTGITGEGAENALAMLVREHVGPRLDRLESRCAASDLSEQATPFPL